MDIKQLATWLMALIPLCTDARLANWAEYILRLLFQTGVTGMQNNDSRHECLLHRRSEFIREKSRLKPLLRVK